MSGPLTHLDESGRARMVDVADKAVTAREAVRGPDEAEKPKDGAGSTKPE